MSNPVQQPHLPNVWPEDNPFQQPPVHYSTVYATLQTLHQEVERPIPNAENPQQLNTLPPSKWVENLQKKALNPLFVYEALQRCHAEQLADTALRNFESAVRVVVSQKCPTDFKEITSSVIYPEEKLVAAKNSLDQFSRDTILPKFEGNRFQKVCQSLHGLGIVLFNCKNAPPKTAENNQAILKFATSFHESPSLNHQLALHLIREDQAITAQIQPAEDSYDLVAFQWDRLASRGSNIPWNVLQNRLQRLQPILHLKEYYPYLFSAFSAKPSILGLSTLLLLKPVLQQQDDQYNNEKWINALKRALYKDFVSDERDQLIVEMAKELMIYRKSPHILNFIKNSLMGLAVTTIFAAHWSEPIHFDTAQAFLKSIREDGVDDFYSNEFIADVASRVEEAILMLQYDANEELKARRLRTVSTLAQVLMELSNRQDPLPLWISEKIRNVVLLLLGIPYIYNAFYQQIANRAYALTLSCTMTNTAHRTEMLEKFLANFKKEHVESYPIPLLLVGGLKPEHVPPSDRNHALAHYALQYKGIFKEPVSEELKERFRNALRQGAFGNSHLEEAITILEAPLQ